MGAETIFLPKNTLIGLIMV